MIHNIDPVIFSIGPLPIRYYGLIYMSGFVVAYFFLKYAAKARNLNLTKEDISDFIFLGVICIVIGSRLFEVIFYGAEGDQWYYFKNPLKIFAVWEGGLSFHGGLFGSAVAAIIFTRKKKMPLTQLGDLIAIPAAFALFTGRIANFLNSELPGLPVENQVNPPWYAVKFMRYSDHLWRIPTQILESFKNLIIFTILLLIWKKFKNHAQGLLMYLFILLYGTFRFIIEFFKDVYSIPSLGLTTGHLLCIPMIIIGLVGIYFSVKKSKNGLVQKTK